MKKILLALLFLFFSTFSSFAKNFGTEGAVYKIIERDLLEEIKEKLEKAKKDGRLDKFNKAVKGNMIDSIERPKSISGITKAEFSRSWLFDPSVSLDHDLKDQNGRIFYHAYSKVNPLDKISMTQTLVFINGDDKEQVDFALNTYKKKKGKAKIILVQGSVLKLMKEKKVRLYFDQSSKLINKFKIQHVPTLIYQEKKMLRIEEVAL